MKRVPRFAHEAMATVFRDLHRGPGGGLRRAGRPGRLRGDRPPGAPVQPPRPRERDQPPRTAPGRRDPAGRARDGRGPGTGRPRPSGDRGGVRHQSSSAGALPERGRGRRRPPSGLGQAHPGRALRGRASAVTRLPARGRSKLPALDL
ncbi:MAG: hypothetical protein MZV64_67970 [Ignavibacteriales bacterium]|nr:hypothetical protein [Ignavibacteriales bacterium]